MEKRLTDLETKISYQDHFIDELNELVIEQQKQIDKLTQELKKLLEKIAPEDDSGVVDISLEVPPPHY